MTPEDRHILRWLAAGGQPDGAASAVGRLLDAYDGLADEWAAIADGVLHDPRCAHRSCLRCRNEDLTHALAAAIEWHERQRSNEPGESSLIDGWRALVNPPTAPIEALLDTPASSPQGDGDDGSLYQAMLRGGNHLTGTGIQKL